MFALCQSGAAEASNTKESCREAKCRKLGLRFSPFTRRMTMWGTQPRSTWNWKAEPKPGGARAKVESSRRWEGRGGAAGVKGQVWECLLKRTCRGEPSPHTSGIWKLAVCRTPALPDEFSHFHFVKFLVHKHRANPGVNVISERGLLKRWFCFFPISSLVVRRGAVGRKAPGCLQTSPSHSRKHYALTAGQGGAISSKISQEEAGAEGWARMNPGVWIWLAEESGRMEGEQRGQVTRPCPHTVTLE